ncbi:alkanesulfonate monooxygenase [Burkholderia territorii]|uniref:Alkanesulfonate monooxygenase n=1 Tax=Burkholderia territorii TaxID=1503055 RepID=A0A119VLE6_9BURK|nr:LLM class flavin-dependent oxidoreductase [Burkholderia territorii]KAB0686473.1 LLM class flavin-dependent oxidoreductase [Burkholderia territorii]KWN18121.1 alkanesulfonate monooxygenase [Burkholderia territorii]MBM2775683.1 LLM class flavin-dependent oxidoreductase [Burkholderia territorii]VWB70023.1 alkanesulfonate monooxygenase [Burkholderia territorii]
MAAPLRIHWCSPLDSGQKKASEQYQTGALDFDGIVDFAQEADALGIDSLLMGISYHMPDPLPMIGALVRETERVKFILAYRPGLLSPTLFAQIVNTVSWMSNKRIALNLVAGISPDEQAFYGDFLQHDDRYRRADEFLDVLHRFWRGETPLTYEGKHYTIRNAQLGLPFKDGERPYIYLSGASEIAQRTAMRHGDCWLRYGDTPEGIAKASASVLESGCEVGIRMHVLARPTREEAIAEIAAMMENPDEQHRAWVEKFVARCDSEAVKTSFRLAEGAPADWLSPMLWSGAVAYRGGPALCVAGSYAEVADYLLEYKALGVSSFIFSGWPTRDEMRRFCQHVLPLIRAREAQQAIASAAPGVAAATGAKVHA